MKIKTLHILSSIMSLVGAIFVAVFTDNMIGVVIVGVLSGVIIGATIERHFVK